MKIVLFAAAGLMACACGAEGMDHSEADVNEEASSATGQVQQAVSTFTDEFSWFQGFGHAAPVAMTPTANTFCYLTLVQGDFEGGGEVVKIYPSAGTWMLGGASGQVGVAARARCIPTVFHGRTLLVSEEVPWSQGQLPKDLAPDDGFRVCLLSRVQGKFHGAGEVVEVTRSNGRWFLQGASQQAGVAAGARCVTNVLVAPGTKTISRYCSGSWGLCDDTPKTDLGAINAGPELNGVCGLGKMSGKFEGGGEWVQVFAENGRWWLNASGGQQSVYSASAFCFL